ncbi:MAG: sugar-transfer associated ATP-grasp domain-containing protein [Bacteroidota bacterium]
MIKTLTKKLIQQTNNYRYHSIHKNAARNVLSNIEAEKGKTNPKLLKMADDYAINVLGWKGYAPWLYVYSAITDSFKEGWIPDNYYGSVVVPSIKGDHGEVSDLKTLTKKIFSSELIPDIAYFINGLWLSSSYQILQESQIKHYIFKNTEKVVYKLDNSRQGKGVYFIDKNFFNLKKIELLGNGVFQDFIVQNSFFEEIIPLSVATIRITTVVTQEGEITVRACYLRLGRRTETHVQSKSHIRVPVNIVEGELSEIGYLSTWTPIDRHPDTNIVFANKKIPLFNECLSAVLKLHKMQPYIRSIGWDLIIDENEAVKIMEYNGAHNDIKFSEATQGPCFTKLGWEKLWMK